MHSYKEPEVVVKCLDIIKYHIGYVKVWNEAGIEAYNRPAPAIPLRLRVYVYVISIAKKEVCTLFPPYRENDDISSWLISGAAGPVSYLWVRSVK